LYDNENFEHHASETMGESEFDNVSGVHDSIQNLQKGLNKITNNYVQKVKTQIEVAMSKVKINEPVNRRPGNRRPEIVQRYPERGAGDRKLSPGLIQKANNERQECYRRIEASLNRMKYIDSFVEEMLSKSTH
jgi:hypothetical protein